MPRASKRKSSGPLNPPSAKSSEKRSGKTKSKELQRLDNLYDKYANEGMIDPDGIMALCQDLQLEHTDVRLLIFAWKLKAAKMGYFTRDEWQTGLKSLKADTITKLKKAVSTLEKEVKTPANFEDFVSFAFRYHLTEEKQKCIDIETICELLNLVLGSRYPRQVDMLVDYLKIQSDYKVINLDQWESIFRFCKEISFPDLHNYDETQAWPLILDNFVEWLRQKQT